MYDFIAIEGNIGAGKTTLANAIAESLNRRLILEEFADNPFLPGFYDDPLSKAFPLELFFLAERYHQLKGHFSSPDLFKQRTVSDYFIGKSLVFSQNNLDEDELQLFRNLYDIMFDKLPRPDLVLYLYSGVNQLLKNIEKRGRDFESSIEKDYLIDIQTGYMEFFRQQKELRCVVLNMENVDFVGNKDHIQRIFSLIDRKFPVGLTFIDQLNDI